MTIQKILVALDFSAPAGRALQWAQLLARSTGAQLEVVHVHPDLYDGRSTPELGLPWPSAGQEERYMRFLQQEVANAVQSALEAGADSKPPPLHIVRGDPAKRILALAEQIGADMICVGATGKGGVQRLLLGSVSQHVLRASKAPVLVVH